MATLHFLHIFSHSFQFFIASFQSFAYEFIARLYLGSAFRKRFRIVSNTPSYHKIMSVCLICLLFLCGILCKQTVSFASNTTLFGTLFFQLISTFFIIHSKATCQLRPTKHYYTHACCLLQSVHQWCMISFQDILLQKQSNNTNWMFICNSRKKSHLTKRMLDNLGL